MDLELRNISVKLSGKTILKSIDLKVRDGEFVSLLGASGCGKSTMLKTIAGIVSQSEGSILIDGNAIDNIPPHKRSSVIVFQDFRLFPHMTVLENISFPLKMLKFKKIERQKIAVELLRKVKLSGFEDRYVDEISGGQIQRVALARALASKPSILLLDESFSSLDVNLRKDMRDLVLKLQKEYKITTISVTHDQDEALTMSDRIAFMHNGQIEQYDTPENIFKNPKNTIVADYFSEGVYVNGEIMNNRYTSKLFSAHVDKSSGQCRCLIRPTAVNVSKNSNGDFIVTDKIYKGDSYLLKLYDIQGSFKLESVVPDSMDILEGDRVNIELNKDKLIYISD